jgi:flotillin
MALFFRVVVKTNVVHIVQRRRETVSYGAGLPAGNIYYRWPSWLPRIGVVVVELPVSNFELSLKDYDAYDKDRVPFVVDVVAFFRINKTDVAAQRVSNIIQLNEQLKVITQGAVRKVLATADINQIMLERATFGKTFTDEVDEQLKQWGVEPVKAIELMDIRDGHGSKVISSIMAKKTSHIESESRQEVAKNHQLAEQAEIAAEQAVSVRKQEAEELIGKRTAEKTQTVGIANQASEQAILSQKEETAKKEMAVQRVQQVKQAEIEKDKQIVAAEQEKQKAVLKSEGDLQSEQNKATAIEAVGRAQGEAETAKLRAPVVTQIELAKEIGENANYQQYLQAIKSIEVAGQVGTEQAKALQRAEIKVIANADGPANGLSNVMDLFTAKGGKSLGFSLEALAGTPMGEKVLAQFGVEAKSKGNGELKAE